MRQIEYIVIHHSASLWGSKSVIDDWHRKRGWRKIGYHFVINNGYPEYFLPNEAEDKYRYEWDGKIEKGRDIEEVGAHVKGYNQNSIGICLIGMFTFTLNQFISLASLLLDLKNQFPDAQIVGHSDLDPVNKANCPGFDVRAFLEKFSI